MILYSLKVASFIILIALLVITLGLSVILSKMDNYPNLEKRADVVEKLFEFSFTVYCVYSFVFLLYWAFVFFSWLFSHFEIFEV